MKGFVHETGVPKFLVPGMSFVEDNFPTDLDGGKGDGLGKIPAHYIYCVLYFSYYYTSST